MKIEKLALKLIRHGDIALAMIDAPAHAGWYLKAAHWLYDLDAACDLAPGTSAGVVAALSPMQSWDTQLKFTERIVIGTLERIQSGRDPLPGVVGPGFLANKRKAVRILQGEHPGAVLSGNKVKAFWRNLQGDLQAVTIDRHAAEIAGWDKTLTDGAYAYLVTCYTQAAAHFNLEPAEFQAVLWEYWRKLKRALA